MHYLRQSTASQEILLGPFVDSTDGSTAETALTINASDIKIWKHGATTEANKNSGGATHIAAGRYYAVLDATDTNTVGMMEVNVSVSGALPVRRPYMVLEEAIYDMLFASSANGDPAGITAIKTVTDRLDTALELDGAVYRFTANALEQAPSSGLDAAGVRAAVGLASANLDVQLSGIQSGVTSILAFNGSTFTSIPWNPAWDAEVQSECADALVVYAPLTTLGANAPANWINAASIAASALNDKGNWNIGKTGYSLSSTQSFNLTGNITGNLSGSVGSVTSPVTAGTVSDKTGYSLTQTFPTNFSSLSIDGSGNVTALNVSAIKTVTDRLDTALELDGAVYRFTANALEQAPSSGLDASGIRSAIGLASANLDTQLSGIQSSVNTVLNFNGSTLSAIPWNPAWDAEVQSECADALAAYAPLTSLGANAPAGWINAASIAASAMNGKGDWNIGKTGYSLSSSQTFSLTGNITGNLSGSVGSVTNAVSVTSASINSIADQVWDEAYSQHTTAGTFGKLMDILRKSNYVTDGTVIAGSTPTTTTFRTDLTQPNDTYDHQTLLFLSGNLEGESKPILSYTQANGVIVLDEPLTEVPQIGDSFVVLPTHVHPISIMTTAFQAGLATSAAQATAQADLDILTGTDGATISTDSITAIFSHLIENGVTFKQLLRAVAAIQVGEISNAGQSTETYKAIGNEGTTRVSAEVDEDGNRNNVTLTL